jgi:hypothetical protein
MLWLHNNKILRNSAGQVADSDACCCGGCTSCDRTPSEIHIEFLADLNLAGSCPNCADWIAAWALKALTPEDISNLFTAYPATFSLCLSSTTEAGCWFGLFEGLPCGAEFIVARINNSDMLTVYIGWSDGTWVAIGCFDVIAQDGLNIAPRDCVAGLTQANFANWFVTWSESMVSPPCDFNMIGSHAGAMLWTAVA